MFQQKINNRILVCMTAIIIANHILTGIMQADDAQISTEHQIKAAFLFNFLRFVKCSKKKMEDTNGPIIIGLIGKDVFGDAFDDIKDRRIEDRPIVLKRFKGIKELQRDEEQEKKSENSQLESVRKSHLLFICPSEKQHIKEILKLVQGHGVLTVADTEGFLENGGMINLLNEDNKIQFEINITATKKEEFQVRSKLLRLAKRVYELEDQ